MSASFLGLWLVELSRESLFARFWVLLAARMLWHVEPPNKHCRQGFSPSQRSLRLRQVSQATLTRFLLGSVAAWWSFDMASASPWLRLTCCARTSERWNERGQCEQMRGISLVSVGRPLGSGLLDHHHQLIQGLANATHEFACVSRGVPTAQTPCCRCRTG